MPSDDLLVALISETVNAETRPRRLAALVLVEVLRNGKGVSASGSGSEMIEAAEGVAVASEIRLLVAKYRIGAEEVPTTPLPSGHGH